MRWTFYSLLVVNVIALGYAFFSGQLIEGEVASRNAASVISNNPNSFPINEKVDELEEGSLVLLREAIQGEESIASVRVRPDVMETSNKTANVRAVMERAEPEGADFECVRVGAFSSVVDAERFVERLSVLGARAEVKNLLVSSSTGYWLHLSPQPSRKEVLRRLNELHRQKIDSYVIPDGELVNGISLGMFSEAHRAEQLKKEIQNLGYQPEILEVPREKRELWVFLKPQESIKINPNSWSKLLLGKELAKKEEKTCSDVASS